ncbi:RNA chaperone Hfq [Granulicella sp. WH15]|uniref:RNA chaperone Hfq n=1 Tax=Granulicella sp. WH15 TaxID=2602070 RepID=UPI0021032BF0|nr:RNA chaperone Hfq [Granulicella sp. WH15]
MESKPAQNIQDTFLNTVRKDKSPITIYLVSGVKLTGKIRSFDKYSVLLENNSQEQLIFKHAISTVVSGRAGGHMEMRPDTRSSEGRESRSNESRPELRHGVTVAGHGTPEVVAAAAE